jgi:UDP-glucose 4-epimerase
MRVVITGSSGRLGRALSEALRQAGHQATGLDLMAGPETKVTGSIANRAVIDRALAFGADAVIHTAALHQPDLRRASMRAFLDVNVNGTLNVLEAARAAGVKRVVMASSTSLMIDATIVAGSVDEAVFLDETSGPLAPRNMYGVTKLAAEVLSRLFEADMAITSLRLSRFFAGDDGAAGAIQGDNLRAVELLYRRLTLADAAAACIAALDRDSPGLATYVVSAPTPFQRDEAIELKRDATAVIAHHFPESRPLFAARGWRLPRTIDRVYDSRRIERDMGFRCATDFGTLLDALRRNEPLVF